MNLNETIETFPNQFSWQPIIENKEKLADSPKKLLVCGMGGSGISSRVLSSLYPELSLQYHQTYGLPSNWESSSDSVVILSSYSGNTEEVLDSYEQARESNQLTAVVTAGGKLLEKARYDQVPYIVLPDAPQPRYAIGYSIVAMLHLAGLTSRLPNIDEVRVNAAAAKIENQVVEFFAGKLPVYWGSSITSAQAYIWKILTNESAKQLCVYNIFPELNHNELNAFEVSTGNPEVAVLTFVDRDDHPRERLRAKAMQELLAEKEVNNVIIEAEGDSRLERLITSTLAAMKVTLAMAEAKAVDPEAVNIIENFKSKLQ